MGVKVTGGAKDLEKFVINFSPGNRNPHVSSVIASTLVPANPFGTRRTRSKNSSTSPKLAAFSANLRCRLPLMCYKSSCMFLYQYRAGHTTTEASPETYSIKVFILDATILAIPRFDWRVGVHSLDPETHASSPLQLSSLIARQPRRCFCRLKDCKDLLSGLIVHRLAVRLPIVFIDLTIAGL